MKGSAGTDSWSINVGIENEQVLMFHIDKHISVLIPLSQHSPLESFLRLHSNSNMHANNFFTGQLSNVTSLLLLLM